MAQLQNLDKLIQQLQNRFVVSQQNDEVIVVVGYSAASAIYIHENIEMKRRGLPRPQGRGVYWGPAGQAKFLEQPAREMRGELGKMIAADRKRGLTLKQALLRAGLRLQAASQRLVPVDTGNLRASAFVRVET